MAIHIEEVIDYLVIAQEALTNQHYESVSDFLSFSEGDSETNLHDYLVDELVFTEQLTYTLSTHKFITQMLDFSQSAVRGKEGWIYQNFVMTQSTVQGGKQWQRPTQTLNLSESVVHVSPKSTFDTLDFSETVRLNYRLPKSITQTLAFTDYAVVYVESERFIAVTVPSLPSEFTSTSTISGSIGDAFRAIGQITRTPITVQFTSSRAGTITLPAPDFNNTETIGQTRIQRQSRGGDFIIWRDDMWPTTQEFDMVFSFLTERQVVNLQAFVAQTCGLLVVLRDHNNFTWNVIITSPEVQIETTNYPKATIKVLVVRDEDKDA